MFLEQQKNHSGHAVSLVFAGMEEKVCYGLLGWLNLKPEWPQLKTKEEEQLCVWFLVAAVWLFPA